MNALVSLPNTNDVYHQHINALKHDFMEMNWKISALAKK